MFPLFVNFVWIWSKLAVSFNNDAYDISYFFLCFFLCFFLSLFIIFIHSFLFCFFLCFFDCFYIYLFICFFVPFLCFFLRLFIYFLSLLLTFFLSYLLTLFVSFLFTFIIFPSASAFSFVFFSIVFLIDSKARMISPYIPQVLGSLHSTIFCQMSKLLSFFPPPLY